MNQPRILAPDLIDVVLLDGGEAVIERGPRCDVPYAEPRDLREDAWFIPVGRGEPATRVDLGGHRRVAARVAGLRWVRASAGGSGAALHISRRERRARLVWRDGAGRERTFAATDEALWRQVLGSPGEDAADWERRRAASTPAWDRVTRALSGGAISMRDVELANWAAGLRTEGLDLEERLLAEVEQYAGRNLEAARALSRALDQADADAPTWEAPPYGRATRMSLPTVTLAAGADLETDGLLLPAESVWRVTGVEDWEPPAAAERRRQSFARWQQRIQDARVAGRRRELLAWGGLIGSLCLAALTFFVWRMFRG